jgi:hypothetical protein
MQGSTSAVLRSFLEHPSRPADTVDVPRASGLLFTIACAPELVKPSEWILIVFGEADAGYASLEVRPSQRMLVGCRVLAVGDRDRLDSPSEMTVKIANERLK